MYSVLLFVLAPLAIRNKEKKPTINNVNSRTQAFNFLIIIDDLSVLLNGSTVVE